VDAVEPQARADGPAQDVPAPAPASGEHGRTAGTGTSPADE